MKKILLLPSLILLLLLTACGAGTSTQSGAVATPVATPSPTPTVGITPTPTIPNVPSRLVHFLTSDHVKLGGLLYGHGKVMVICSHMLHTDKTIWTDSGIPQLLAARGYQVLAYDFRGNGDSAGPADISLLDIDLRAAIAFAHQQGAEKIVLLGASMGGTASLKVAASVPVAAVVTLSAPETFVLSLSDAEVRRINAPKLFINSENDDYAGDTSHMYAIASQPKSIHLYPGSAHGTDIFDTENAADLTQRILNFIGQQVPAGA